MRSIGLVVLALLVAGVMVGAGIPNVGDHIVMTVAVTPFVEEAYEGFIMDMSDDFLCLNTTAWYDTRGNTTTIHRLRAIKCFGNPTIKVIDVIRSSPAQAPS